MSQRSQWLLCATWALFAAPGASAALPAPPPQAAPADARDLLDCIAVVGASMSDGFLLPLEADCMVTLADVVAAARIDVGAPLPFRATTTLFFLNPLQHGAREIALTRAADPTLVVALDFLFWYGYGWMATDAERLARLEDGLALLDTLEVPLIVGDLPDVRDAALHGVGVHGAPMIVPGQVPRPETLEQLNARVRAWAADRDDVVLVEMSRLYAKLRAGGTVSIAGRDWSGDQLSVLIDRDLLHPTLDGTILVALHALERLCAETGLDADAFVWDPAVIRERIFERRSAERDARRATAARRASANDGN